MSRFSTVASATLTAFSILSKAVDACEEHGTCPMQIWMTYAGPTGMTVSWNTYSHLDRPSVRYGTNPHHLKMVASSDVSITYPTSTTYNNHVPLKHLDPDTLYYYLPVDSNATTPYSFRTSRPAGDHTPYSMAVVVDMGVIGPDSLTTHVGTSVANPLKPSDQTTIQSLMVHGVDTKFLWHRRYSRISTHTTIAEGAKVYESLLNQCFDEMTPITA